jgi:hypothetical protein
MGLASEENGMGQHGTCGTTPSDHVHDTIAFGSMLVFASVMPPLGPDTVETDARSARQRVDAADGIEPDSAKASASWSQRRFDS